MHKATLMNDQRTAPVIIWRVWAAMVALIFLGQLITLGLSPTVWQDEVQIVDAGRLLVEPKTDWSIMYDPAGGRMPFISYLGPRISEASYRLAGSSFLGPRILELLVACCCSGLMMSWLMRRGCVGWISLAAAILFLIDPCFDRSYRGGRADALVFLGAIAACWLICSLQYTSSARRKWVLFGAGLLCGILPWIWSAGVLLVPIVFAEFARVIWPQAGRSIGKWVIAAIPVAAGMLLTALGLAIPILDSLTSAIQATTDHVRWDVGAANPASGAATGLLSSIVSVVRYSPFLPLLAILGGFMRGNRLFLVSALLVFVVVAGTRFYLYRYLYLLPYLTVLAAGGMTWLARLPSGRWQRKLATWGPAAAAVAWAVLLTFGVRNYVAFQEKPWRDHENLLSVMEKEIGRGQLKVYLGAFDIYYAGRELSWQMYRSKFPLPEVQMDQIFSRCDVVIRVPVEDTPDFQVQIKRLGFDDGVTLHVGPHAMPPEFQRPRYGGMAYGPYRVYRRTVPN